VRCGTYGFGLVVLAVACAPSRESITAGQIGCPPDEVTIGGEDSSSGFLQSSETWTAECRGRVFICTKLTTSTLSGSDKATFTEVTDADVSCREELSDEKPLAVAPAGTPVATPKAPNAPNGGAGFELGATAEATQKACESAGHTFERSDARASCSGSATKLGFDVTVALELCGERLCKITLAHEPQAKWSSTLAELKTKLVEKYGTPADGTSGIPAECRSDGALGPCLEKGLRLHYDWSWKSGETLRLLAGKPEKSEGPPAIRLEYARPASALNVDASAL